MKSYVTSYNGLFGRRADAPVVERIEIPIIQRDYAQGRDGESVARIRSKFLDVLHDALATGAPISLDFVYGDVVKGTLRPLDGQQRLTTLFLLHWYLAWRGNQLDQEQDWKRFEYATRPSARRFCRYLVNSAPPFNAPLRAWFEDQPWFLHGWRHDPTIQSMLVMIDAIHERFAAADCDGAWQRLIDRKGPAISFHLLLIEEAGFGDDLYIKMNARGRPLTAFENFKATFEELLTLSCPNRLDEFARKVDGTWADLLWPFRGSDNIVDDEFLRYFQFIADLCTWHDGHLPSGEFDVLAERVFGAANPKAATNLDFLIRSFDTWATVDTPSLFSEFFALTPAPLDSHDTSRVVLYSPRTNVDLFAECCLGQVRRSWPRTLLLYAVLLHRLYDTTEFPRRLRMLRNLIEASGSELRADRMPALLVDVQRLVIEGALDSITSFNQTQLADERLKVEMLAEAPELASDLFHLEDHWLLRGCLAAFELDQAVFALRARAFHELFAWPRVLPLLTGALLAAGDYTQRLNHRFLQLGSGSSLALWREEILTGSSRASLAGVREALGMLLDAIAGRNGDVGAALGDFTNGWLTSYDTAGGLDWRWYFVRYAEMRAGDSGIYACATGSLGYSVCMLDKKVMRSHYRDPYLSAIRSESGVGDKAIHGTVWLFSPEGPWFTGYETEARWMRLTASGAAMQCVQEGLLLRRPTDEAYADSFARICAAHGVGVDLLLAIPQVTVEGCQLDSTDRVQIGAALLRDLVGAGL